MLWLIPPVLWSVAWKFLRPTKAAKASLLGLLLEPSEVIAMVRLKFFGALPSRDLPSPADAERPLKDDVKFCSDMLNKVSRSFAACIRQLPDELCVVVCVFYLALRALDTIEDETRLARFDPLVQKQGREPNRANRVKAQQDTLRAFHAAFYIGQKQAPPVPPPDMEAIVAGKVGHGDEAVLLVEYHRVTRVFWSLPPAQREVIADITRKMGEGMASYVDRDLGAGTADISDYNKYCHIVAGYVGEGLTRQFHASGLEPFTKPGTLGLQVMEMGLGNLASDMGLFLQKVNIIRDYLEDQIDGRSFWPRTIWAKYGKSLSDFKLPENVDAGVKCMNELIADALELTPRCIAYLSGLQTPQVLMFCAAPQVMALLTLNCLVDNEKVLKGVVKVRKPLAARVFLRCSTMPDIVYWFRSTSQELRLKIERSERVGELRPRMLKALDALEAALAATEC
mmetsp:Transcript_8266/g.19442  ORF Transcript_8266/g.19442 Transcript_8266/m.19442 type:complete len:453 (+) Transcript_8266:122-1480(+)